MKRKQISLILSIILAISSFSPLVTFAEDIIITDPATKDIYLNVDSDAGYDATELAAAVESEIVRLGGNDAPSIRINTNNTQIDTTDLSKWYVYDHYDTAYWAARAATLSTAGQIASNDASLAWKNDFRMGSLTDIKRPYTGQTYAEVYGSVYKIQDYLNTNLSGGVQKLDQHIYSGVDNNGAFMTFLGYGVPAYMDYLFYPDTLSGTKTVTYTIDSNNVSTHTLSSTGFLINTGIDASGFIKGYILVYAYTSNTTYTLNLYPIKSGITPQALSNGTNTLTTYLDASITPITSGTLTTYTSTDVTLTIKPDSIKVEHKNPIDTNFTTMKEWTGLTATGYNGFGPYTKYSGHYCYQLTSYKFTNLKMSSSTDAGSLVSAFASLQNADYLESQQIDRYLVNILGANSAYNLTKDSDYLALVQQKQINLFTNKDVSEIESYLPSYLVDSTSSNLSTLATSIANYILGITPGTNSDVPATPVVSNIVANFTLKSGDVQVSQIKRNLIPSAGIILDVTNSTIVPDGVTLGNPTFTLTNPSGSVSSISVPFTVFNDTTNWPTGEYILTMDYGSESIPCVVKFLVLEDTTSPSVSAEKNGNVVDLNFTNTVSVGNNTFTSELDSYVIIMTSTSAIPTSDWTNEVSIIDYAPELITQSGYMHVLIKDSAGNIGHTSIQIVQVFPIIDALPIASGIDYGQSLSASSLSGGRAIYNNEVVSGTFAWTNSTIKPTAGTENSYLVSFTPISAFYATITTNVTISVSKVTPEISLSDKTTSYTGSQISIDPAVVVGVAGVEAPTGTVSYTYYTDISCTTLTTNGNSGAALNGAAPVKAGTYYAKATIAGTTNYTSATTAAPATLEISANIQGSLSIGNDLVKNYSDASFVLSVTGGSGTGAVTFTSSNPSVISISVDGYVTINAVGNSTIIATKAADRDYMAQTASMNITVNPKALTYVITNNVKTYTGGEQYANVVPSVASLKEGVDYTVTYKQSDTLVDKPTEKGDYTITVSTINGNYTGSATGTLTINTTGQSGLNISGVPVNDIQYSNTFTLTANGGSGTGSVTWRSSDDNVATVESITGDVSITGVGTVTITVTKASDANYDSQTAMASFTTTPKVITVTATATDRDYFAGSINVTVTLSTDVPGVTASCTSATVLNAFAGEDKEVKVTGVTLSNDKYTPARTSIYTTVTIRPIMDTPLIIEGLPSSIIYGDDDITLTATSTGTGLVTWSSNNSSVARVNSSTGVVTINGVGDAKITASKATDGSYEGQSASIDLTVVPKEVTYTITGNTKPYTGESIYAAIIPNIATLVEGFDYSVTYSQNDTVVEEPTESGEYEITVTTLNSDYTGESTGAILTIQSVDQTYTLQIGGLPSFIEYEDTFALYGNGGNGEGEIDWEVTSGDSFATINSSGLVEIIGVGSVTITLTKAGDGNYNEQIQSTTFIANKKEIVVSISETAKKYNGTVQTVSVNGTQTLNNTLADILDVSYVMQADITQTAFRNVGTYNVSASVKTAFEDLYALEGYVSAVATIDKTNIVITAVDKTKTYGDSNPELTLDYDLAGTDTDDDFILPIVTCSATEDSNVGDYDIILSYERGNENTNYNVILVNGKMTINKAQLSVTADEKNVRYSSSAPQYTVSYDGFVLDQTPSVLEGALAVECSYTKGNGIGAYTITPSGLTSGNYEITFVNSVLNVSELPVTITASGSTSTITLQLVPAVSGLTQTNFTILQGEEEITPTRISERDGGAKYYISAPLTAEKEYTIVVNNGDNYAFNSASFISKPSVGSSGGGGSVYVEPIIQSTLTFNIGKINSYQKIGSNNPIVHIMDAAPIISENRTLLPIRFVVEPLGGTIKWDAVEKKVTIVKDDITIELWIGNHIAKVNGVDTMIDPENENVKPIIAEPGRTMLPIRFISETLGCTVEWNEVLQEITVKY